MTPRDIYDQYRRGYSPMLISVYSTYSLDEVKAAIHRMEHLNLIQEGKMDDVATFLENHPVYDRHERQVCAEDEIKAARDADLYLRELYKLAYGVDPDHEDNTLLVTR